MPRRPRAGRLPTSRWTASISRTMSIIGWSPSGGRGTGGARGRRSRLPRASSVASESSRCSQNRRKWSSQSSSLAERFGVDGIEPSCALRADGREPAVTEDLEVLGHRRLRDPELGLDDGRDRPRGQLAIGEQLEDPSPDRVSQDVERVHDAQDTSNNLYKSRLRQRETPGDPRRRRGSAGLPEAEQEPQRDDATEDQPPPQPTTGRDPARWVAARPISRKTGREIQAATAYSAWSGSPGPAPCAGRIAPPSAARPTNEHDDDARVDDAARHHATDRGPSGRQRERDHRDRRDDRQGSMNARHGSDTTVPDGSRARPGRRRSRDGGRARSVGGLLALAAAAAVAFVGWSSAAAPRPTAHPDQVSTDPQVLEAGRVLFTANCASCHGADATGGTYGPTLIGSGAAAVDFYLRTGRMPASGPGQRIVRQPPAFADAEIEALVAYVASLAPGPEIPQVNEGRQPAARPRAVHRELRRVPRRDRLRQRDRRRLRRRRTRVRRPDPGRRGDVDRTRGDAAVRVRRRGAGRPRRVHRVAATSRRRAARPSAAPARSRRGSSRSPSACRCSSSVAMFVARHPPRRASARRREAPPADPPADHRTEPDPRPDDQAASARRRPGAHHPGHASAGPSARARVVRGHDGSPGSRCSSSTRSAARPSSRDPADAVPRRAGRRHRRVGAGADVGRAPDRGAPPTGGATGDVGSSRTRWSTRRGSPGGGVLQVGLLGALGGLGTALAIPVFSLGPAPGRSLFVTPWTAGAKVVGGDGAARSTGADIPVDGVLTVFPEGFAGSAEAQTLLINVGARRAPARPATPRRGHPTGSSRTRRCAPTPAARSGSTGRRSTADLPVPPVDVRRAAGRRAHVRAGGPRPCRSVCRSSW